MACTEEKPIFKHYCRICKKGFMCGRALGGHMRAHGIGDESGNVDDDDPVSDWEDKHGHRSGSSRRMYQLRTNPNRLKSCRVCEHCGKEFLSWKSFLEHGKCNSEDAESLVSSPSPSPGSDVDGEYELDGGGRRRSCQWSKRKRSLRTKVGSFNSSAYLSSEDEDLLLAKCLVDLANAKFEADEPEESCASASREEERRNPVTFHSPSHVRAANYKSASKGLFECKACKKVFNSHQALGGHRASHKKVKGCYAAKQDQQQLQVDDSMAGDEDVITHDQEFFPSKSASSSFQFEQGSKWTTAAGASSCRRKSKVHECTICHRIFSTGQALGGHKRCHWMTSNTHQDPKNVQLHDHHDQVDQVHHHHQASPPQAQEQATPTSVNDETEVLDLNLNLPAHHHQGIEMKRDPQNPLSFEVYTGIRLQIWSNNNAETEAKDNNVDDHDHHHRRNQNKGGDEDNIMETKIMVEDEADSKVKLEKLSELKGISISGSSSPWLQVGIGNSTTDVASGP